MTELKFKDTEDKSEVIKQIRQKINGNAPDGFRYSAEREGDEIIFKIKAI